MSFSFIFISLSLWLQLRNKYKAGFQVKETSIPVRSRTVLKLLFSHQLLLLF